MIALHLRADEQTLNDRVNRVRLVLVRSGGWRFPSPRAVEQARFDAWRRLVTTEEQRIVNLVCCPEGSVRLPIGQQYAH